MIIADLVADVTVVSVPIAWALGGLSLAQLLVVALVGGTCTVFYRTGDVKLLPQIVRDAGLETANARVFGTESAMQGARAGLPEHPRHSTPEGRGPADLGAGPGSQCGCGRSRRRVASRR
jgi:hypothetical protein